MPSEVSTCSSGSSTQSFSSKGGVRASSHSGLQCYLVAEPTAATHETVACSCDCFGSSSSVLPCFLYTSFHCWLAILLACQAGFARRVLMCVCCLAACCVLLTRLLCSLQALVLTHELTPESDVTTYLPRKLAPLRPLLSFGRSAKAYPQAQAMHCVYS